MGIVGGCSHDRDTTFEITVIVRRELTRTFLQQTDSDTLTPNCRHYRDLKAKVRAPLGPGSALGTAALLSEPWQPLPH